MLRDTNPSHWKLLVFYYNPAEPRLFVAKRTGGPATLNFAKPAAWAIIAVAVAIPTTFSILHGLNLVR
jgi:uncharacterized membrane protein